MEMFESLIRRITVLDSSSALTLLEASLDYDLEIYNDRTEWKDSISALIFFQRECIGTLTEEWEELLDMDQDRIARIMASIVATRRT